MDTQPIPVDLGSAQNLWVSLDDLRRMALAAGCTPAQFTYAVEATGRHPVRVARYLKRHSFLPVTFKIPNE
jgi:Protein of unknown function (DUF3606)